MVVEAVVVMVVAVAVTFVSCAPRVRDVCSCACNHANTLARDSGRSRTCVLACMHPSP